MFLYKKLHTGNLSICSAKNSAKVFIVLFMHMYTALTIFFIRCPKKCRAIKSSIVVTMVTIKMQMFWFGFFGNIFSDSHSYKTKTVSKFNMFSFSTYDLMLLLCLMKVSRKDDNI